MKLAFHLIALLPLWLLQGIGATAGWLLFLFPNSRQRTAVRNVERCFPELSAAARRRLVRRSLTAEMTTFLETPMVWLCPERRLLSLVKSHENLALFDAAMKGGKGMLLLTIHMGSFEAGAIPLSAQYRLAGIYKPQKGALNDLSVQGRSRCQGILVPAVGGAGQTLMKLLDEAYGCYIMPDQDPPEGRGVFAPFFGIQAHTPTLAQRIARARPGLPVVLMWVERLPWARGFAVHFSSPSPGFFDPDPLAAATSLNADLEKIVRRCPEQYWWGYKRFRRRPPGEPAFYD
jgi:KDO2-lipid IV(A) lauroyltransferase